MRHALTAALLLALLALPTPGVAQEVEIGTNEITVAVEPKTSLPDLEDEVMCTTCGVPLEHVVDNPTALQERELIRELIAQGLTKDEIKDRLVAEFGEEVLAIPDNEGFDLAAWLVPGAAVIAAAVAIFVGLRRWRRAGGPGEDGPQPDGSEPVSGEDAKRLDEDLARYEL